MKMPSGIRFCSGSGQVQLCALYLLVQERQHVNNHHKHLGNRRRRRFIDVQKKCPEELSLHLGIFPVRFQAISAKRLCIVIPLYRRIDIEYDIKKSFVNISH